VVEVEQRAEIRRMHFVLGVSINEIARRRGRDRNTIRTALGPRRRRSTRGRRRGRKLDPFKDEIHRLLKQDARMPGQRIGELIAPLGCDGGRTIVDDCLREVRPLFDPPRTFQRTIYRLGEICQFDLWEPKGEIAVGHGQTRKGWVVIGCLGYSRAGAGALVFSKQTGDLLFGSGVVCGRWGRCLRRWSGTAKRGCTGAMAARRRRSPGSAAR
jgi:transposase